MTITKDNFHWRIQKQRGCWIWQGAVRPSGHVNIHDVPAHRKIWELLVGPIPEGHDLHHTCPNKACVNPKHLQPVMRDRHMALHYPEGVIRR